MSKLKYFFNNGRFTALGLSGRSTDELEIDLGLKTNGTLTADTYSAEITDGKCKICLSRLPDGVYTPYIVSDGKRMRADGFEKKNGTVILPPLPNAEVRALTEGLAEARGRISRLEEAVRILSDRVSHPTIF